MEKQKIEERQQKIIELLTGFCTKSLDDEYLNLAIKLTEKLGRKKEVPFITGKVEIWAAAIIHALGTINFLFDKSFEPYTTIDELNAFFGTSKSTSGSKSKLIRDLLKLDVFDKEFSTAEVQKGNPFANLEMVNGIIVSKK